MELITLENIRKTYKLGEQDVPVLKGVSMTIARGTFYSPYADAGHLLFMLLSFAGVGLAAILDAVTPRAAPAARV